MCTDGHTQMTMMAIERWHGRQIQNLDAIRYLAVCGLAQAVLRWSYGSGDERTGATAAR
jgi:hypothetical protein